MQVVTETPQAYLGELEQAINNDRESHGKKPLPPAKEANEEKTVKVSTTDPESGFYDAQREARGLLLSGSSHGGSQI